jgi:S-adenosyl methyltransferase
MGYVIDAADDEFWEEPIGIDTEIPHMARVYDYLLGGRNHFAVDRQLAEHATAALPGGIEAARRSVRADRQFLKWAVRYLAAEQGVRQFLDIGTGIPNDDNVHAVAQQIAPECRVVYVDHDPIVLAHARFLLRGTAEGATDYLDVDLREPETILHRAAATLDFAKPVAILLLGVLHYILDDEDPYGIVARLVDAVPPGSYLVVSHLASDIQPEAMAELARRHNESAPAQLAAIRSHAEVARFFDGLELLPPGVVSLDHWCNPDAADQGDHSNPPTIPIYGAVARIA